VDTNTHTIARALRDIGLDLYRTSTVGDNVERIAEVVKESVNRADAVITTGGLGPTIDDPTREAIAMAFSAPLEYKEVLWEEILERFSRFGATPSENNKRQAFIPRGALPISNPVGTAPAFILETESSVVISLPGVPAELVVLLDEVVIPYLKKKLKLKSVIKARILRTAGVGESWLDNEIADLERLSNPTVGLAAHPGRVDIRITAKGDNNQEVDEMLWKMEATIRQRLGSMIFGTDDLSLEKALMQKLEGKGWNIMVFEQGTEGVLGTSLEGTSANFVGGKAYSKEDNWDPSPETIQGIMAEHGAQVGIVIQLHPGEMDLPIEFSTYTPEGVKHTSRVYAGPSENAPKWAISYALAYLHKKIS
jgi:competence/damage-inducible protein CinA-like protein